MSCVVCTGYEMLEMGRLLLDVTMYKEVKHARELIRTGSVCFFLLSIRLFGGERCIGAWVQVSQRQSRQASRIDLGSKAWTHASLASRSICPATIRALARPSVPNTEATDMKSGESKPSSHVPTSREGEAGLAVPCSQEFSVRIV